MAVNIVPQTPKPKPMNTRKTERRIKQRDSTMQYHNKNVKWGVQLVHHLSREMSKK